NASVDIDSNGPRCAGSPTTVIVSGPPRTANVGPCSATSASSAGHGSEVRRWSAFTVARTPDGPGGRTVALIGASTRRQHAVRALGMQTSNEAPGAHHSTAGVA